MTSIAEGARSPQQLLGETRRYWTVENKKHWKRDAVWHEDKARMRAPAIGRALALLRSALLALVKHSGQQPLPQKLEAMHREPSLAIALIQNQRLT